MIVALARASSREVEIHQDMKVSHLFLLYNFKVKTFFRSFSHNAHTKQLTFHYV